MWWWGGAGGRQNNSLKKLFRSVGGGKFEAISAIEISVVTNGTELRII